jgi:protocatechuate 3,4-dioxygenase beta subunit
MIIKDNNKTIQNTTDELIKSKNNSFSLECNGIATLAKEEGPFYKSGSPERNTIAEPGTPGKKLIVEGYVFNKDCQPMELVWLDFWQADGNGRYDNTGYNLRGHQYTDESGRYRLETVRPVEYGSRTAHIHVKLQASKNSPVVTTQLFLPEERMNETDSIYDRILELSVIDTGEREISTFNFVLDTD